jgi:hypothetical protein
MWLAIHGPQNNTKLPKIEKSRCKSANSMAGAGTLGGTGCPTGSRLVCRYYGKTNPVR